MLQTKSFKVGEGEAISEFLQNYRIASGATIMVSNGEILLPFEDGLPATKAQQIIDMQIQSNEMSVQQNTLRHSIKVVEAMNVDLDEKVKTATADLAEAEVKENSKGKTKVISNLKAYIEELQAQQYENMKAIRQNIYEIKRLETNKELFAEKVDELGK